jgi:hypothetical protein
MGFNSAFKLLISVQLHLHSKYVILNWYLNRHREKFYLMEHRNNVFITNTNLLVISNQVVAVYFGNHPKHKNGPALCGQTAHAVF